jgi:hypothetical protein
MRDMASQRPSGLKTAHWIDNALGLSKEAHRRPVSTSSRRATERLVYKIAARRVLVSNAVGASAASTNGT